MPPQRKIALYGLILVSLSPKSSGAGHGIDWPVYYESLRNPSRGALTHAGKQSDEDPAVPDSARGGFGIAC